MAINVKNMKTWVKALRSGKYKQTTSVLHDEEGFCCLGVACDISGLGKWKSGLYEKRYAIDGGAGSVSVLPIPVRDWLGLKSTNPTVGQKQLSIYNDAGKSFEEIADIIEREYDLKNR